MNEELMLLKEALIVYKCDTSESPDILKKMLNSSIEASKSEVSRSTSNRSRHIYDSFSNKSSGLKIAEQSSLTNSDMKKDGNRPHHSEHRSLSTNSIPPECSKDFQNELEMLNCIVCKSMVYSPGNKLIECLECSNVYHQNCHEPKVKSEDADDLKLKWYCSNCYKKIKRKISPVNSCELERPSNGTSRSKTSQIKNHPKTKFNSTLAVERTQIKPFLGKRSESLKDTNGAPTELFSRDKWHKATSKRICDKTKYGKSEAWAEAISQKKSNDTKPTPPVYPARRPVQKPTVQHTKQVQLSDSWLTSNNNDDEASVRKRIKVNITSDNYTKATTNSKTNNSSQSFGTRNPMHLSQEGAKKLQMIKRKSKLQQKGRQPI